MLKKLIINGFKSFANKTIIDFSNGINIIVGPNGCGKSNIIDAIRWVMGEQANRMLRASNSIDVIFGGSEVASPSSYAEVSIVIDNSKKVLNIEFDEVVITRKIFRSGESVFYINKREVRLKDIHNLFFDTGLGKGSYSIIQQGQIESILSSNPNERILIFKEAAGIVSSKKLIDETRIKLEKVNESLLRLEDILTEVYKNMINLQEQADKARKYKEIEDRIIYIEKALLATEYFSLKKEYDSIKNAESLIQKEEEDIKSNIISIENQIEAVINDISKYEELLDDLREKEKSLEMEEYKSGEKINILRGEHQRLKKELEKIVSNKEKIYLKKNEIESSLSLIDKELSTIKNSITDYEAKEEEFTSNIIEIEDFISKSFESLKRLKEDNKNINKEINDIINEQSSILDNVFKNLEVNKDIIISSVKAKRGASTRVLEYINKLKILLSNNDDFYRNKQECFEIISRLKNEFESYNQEVQNVFSLFEESNILLLDDYSKKLNYLREIYDKNITNIQYLEDEINKTKVSREKILELKNQNYVALSRLRDRYVTLLTESDRLKKEKDNINNTLLETESSINETEYNIQDIESLIFELIDSYENIKSQLSSIRLNKKDYESKIVKMTEELKKMEREKNSLSEKISSIYERKNKINLKFSEVSTKKDIIQSQFFEKYAQKIEDVTIDINSLDVSNIKKEIIELKKKQQELWPVNLLAIDEYEEVSKRYEYLNNNKNDILKAKKDLEFIIEETNEKMRSEFIKTFNEIQRNLEYTFKRAFGGGECLLELQDKNDILNSGIEIIARPPGKKLKNISLLSGGERTMIALSIIFAIFMRKVSPFCLLDEVDAALDEANVKRFINLVENFSKSTQFIIITHNRITAQHGDVFFGVTMQEPGITKVFSFKPDNLDYIVKEETLNV